MATEIELIREWVRDGKRWCSRGDGLPCAESRRILAALEHVANSTDELALSNDLAAYVLRPALDILTGKKEQDNA